MLLTSALNATAIVILTTVLLLIATGILHALYRPNETHDGENAVHISTVDLFDGNFIEEPDIRIKADAYVVCLSNGYASNREWQCLLKHWPRKFDEKRVRFLMPSIVGMGKSRIPQNFKFTVAEHTQELMHAIEPLLPPLTKDKASLHLVGICTGGVLALELAARWHPKTLTLISTPYFASESAAWDAGRRYASWYRQIWRLHFLYYAFVRQQWILAPLTRARERAYFPHLPHIYDCVMDGEACAFTPNIENIMAVHRPQRSARYVGGSSATKTMIIHGESDRILCNATDQKALAEDTNAESFIVRAKKGANHFIAWNYTSLVLGQVSVFIQENL